MSRMITILVFALIAPVATAAEPLHRNPFRVPIELVGGPIAERTTSRVEAGRGTLDLRATLVAGRRSSVNLGGSILSLGDEVAGYRLVSVREGEAVFYKDGEAIRAFVNEDDVLTDGRDER